MKVTNPEIETRPSPHALRSGFNGLGGSGFGASSGSFSGFSGDSREQSFGQGRSRDGRTSLTGNVMARDNAGPSFEQAQQSAEAQRGFGSAGAQRAAEVVPAVLQQIERLRRSGTERLNVTLPLEDGQIVDLRLKLFGGSRVQITLGEMPEALRASLREGWGALADEAATRGLAIDFQWDAQPKLPRARFA
ncbi:MAG: hypothetical protein ACFBZ8_01485 [Opitutales bacterium]